MTLSSLTSLNLLKQLYNLSSQEQLQPHLDEQLSSRLKNTFQRYKHTYFEDNQQQRSQQKYRNTDQKDFKKKKYKTEIEEINDLYEQKFSSLFQDEQIGDQQCNVLGEIKQKNQMQRHNKNRKKQVSNNKRSIQKLHYHKNKQNVNSLSSTYQKINIFKTQSNQTPSKTSLIKSKSKEKLICYKVQNQNPMKTPSKLQSDSCSKPTKKSKSKSKTPTKLNASKDHTKSITSLSRDNCKLKRSQSQMNCNKLLKTSANSTLKRQIITSTTSLKSKLKNCQSKCSTIGLSNGKDTLKNTKKWQFSLQSTTKHPIKSLSTIQLAKDNLINKKMDFIDIKKDVGSQQQIINRNFFYNDSIKNLNRDQQNEQDRLFQEIQIATDKNKFEFCKQSQDICRISQKKHQNQERQFNRTNTHLNFKNHIFCQNDPFKPNQNQNSYLKQMIVQINSQHSSILNQKQNILQHVLQLRQALSRQKRILSQITLLKHKTQVQLQVARQSYALVEQNSSLVKKTIIQKTRQLKTLHKSISQNKAKLKKISEQQIKQEQQLIEMYTNVIDQLKKELKQQKKMKVQLKDQLQIQKKLKQSKQVTFKSNYSTNRRVKTQLSDIFKEWC